MSEIPKAYEPQSVEDKWYETWQEKGCFTADPGSPRPAYSIVIPPPNVTGMLHMGHVLNNTIQDILARKARMDGREVLWLPGTDHAGIATQVMVEKSIKREGLNKYDLGREKFLERVWEWKEKHGGIIINQLKKLGCSCDWTRKRFTMDEDYSRCVQKVFVELYKKGLIYRGKRMVNWCPASLTALSDEEVEMTPQKGFLWYFKVEVAEEPGTFLTIATTRPETIPGDTAIAVNPKDERYGHLVGKHAIRPLPRENQAHIPIVADEHIDTEFGTGVLKVTPAHDKADFEIGERHKLEVIDVLNADGTMNDLAGEDLAGLDRFEARQKAAELLEELGVLEKEEPYENKVGFSERAKVPIEPRLSEQWFLKYPSVKAAHECVTNGDMKFFPDRWVKTYDHWMANIQDWCISRQLWWGHRVPVWHGAWVMTAAEIKETLYGVIKNAVADGATPEEIESSVLGVDGKTCPLIKTKLEAFLKAVDEKSQRRYVAICTLSAKLGDRCSTMGLDQDPDVLDTWFSSWLWPFATMGWPEQTDTLKKFYPTTDLVTGPDIIFFWVARMIMAGCEFMGDIPFRNVYFTGIIRDKKGRKMSKTLGNSPDPLELIGKYGADALRFGTMRSAPLGLDVLFDEKDVELGRNFCNKLWNACRFRQMQGGDTEGEIDPALLTSDDKWILLRLDTAIREIDDDFAEYRFTGVTQTLYRFFWSEYCDWYVESCKAAFFGDDAKLKANKLAVIDFVLSNTLRLFHPFLPFITEELWHGLGYDRDLPADQGGQSIMTANWPKEFDTDFKGHYGLDESDARVVEAKYDLVKQGRNLRREFNIPSNRKIEFIFTPNSELPPSETDVLKVLLNAEPLTVDPHHKSEKGVPHVASDYGQLFLPVRGLIDIDAERARLQKELGKVEKEIEKVQVRLNNPNFKDKVPPDVLAEHRSREQDWIVKRDRIHNALDALAD